MNTQSALERLDSLQELTLADATLSESMRGRLLRLFEVVADAFTRLPFLMEGYGEADTAARRALENLLEMFPQVLAEGDSRRTYIWGRVFVSTLEDRIGTKREEYRVLGKHIADEQMQAMSEVLHNLAVEDERLSVLEDEQRSRAQAAELADSAERAALRVQEAAGITGGASLSSHFATYANREETAANLFRVLTILAILGALAAAILLPHPNAGDWVNLAYRLAQLVGIAALATYFAQQSAQHRRVSNWAMSMQVQLQSFPAFMEPVEEGPTKSAIYDAFARRVLGPPPEKGAVNAEEDSLLSPQLLELLLMVAKKS